jgi:hypothetical protein
LNQAAKGFGGKNTPAFHGTVIHRQKDSRLACGGGKSRGHIGAHVSLIGVVVMVSAYTLGAGAAARGIGEMRRGRSQVRSLQNYHAGIK